MTHICVSALAIIGSDNGLSPGRRQAIIWSNAGIFYWTIGHKLQRNIYRNWYIFIRENPFENVVWNTAAILSRSQYVNNLCQCHCRKPCVQNKSTKLRCYPLKCITFFILHFNEYLIISYCSREILLFIPGVTACVTQCHWKKKYKENTATFQCLFFLLPVEPSVFGNVLLW